jgi:hypothetical protein
MVPLEIVVTSVLPEPLATKAAPSMKNVTPSAPVARVESSL